MRRKRPRSEITVALFPFLAVLVCTMGSLIVLLVMVVQQAHLHASDQQEELESAQPAELQKLADETERLQWRRELLEPQRAELQEKLANSRGHLSHLEEEIRRLQGRWSQLAEQMKSLAGQPRDATPTDEAGLERLRSELAKTQAEIDELKKRESLKKPAYSIIPYDGPNGTRRRPIYIECTGDRLILQPEGLVLTQRDFEGPVGPGNPLDAALRAIREHLSAMSQVNPYPLLVVRPDGANAYAMARHAMSSWEDEFGYELIDAELKLEFPATDPALTDKLRETIAAARQRQVLLAAAMPRQFRGAQGNGFVVSSSGGLRPIGGQVAGDGDGRGSGGRHGSRGSSDGPTGRGVGRRGLGGGAGRRGLDGSGAGGAGGRSGSGFGSGFGDGPGGSYADRQAPQTPNSMSRYPLDSQHSTGDSPYGPYASQFGSPSGANDLGSGASSSAGQAAAGSSAAGQENASGSPGANRGDAAGGVPGGRFANGGASDGGAAGGEAAGGEAAGGGAAGGGAAGGGAAGGGAAGGGAAGGGAAGGGAAGGGAQGGSNPPGRPSGSAGNAGRSIAASQGSDWGLPRSNNHAQAVKRPLRVVCSPNRLLILPNRNEFFVPIPTELTGDMPNDVRKFVNGLWKHMEGWGMAVAGGYWTPVLNVEVQPGGEDNYRALVTLLQDSGINVRRHQP